jgi:glycosyltransferase involved in cell wall biosynthesis
MKLLILTQTINKNDPILGFFHRWVEEVAAHADKVTVICLEKGESDLPSNVKVLSLGKEAGNSRWQYVSRFYNHIWQEKDNYDKVFVHMNQEYVLLGGCLWRLWGKKIFLWRNHAYGNILTRIAVLFSHKVFYTSPRSFTAQFRKARQMPVGIDTDFFKPNPSVERVPHSVLFLGRISPVKKVAEFVEWFNTLDEKFTATVAGASLPKDRDYDEKVRGMANERVRFIGPVTQAGALKLYQSHEIYVNKTPAGSFDKTILEAAAAGSKLMVDNPDAQDINPEEHSLKKLMQRLFQEMR